MVEPDHALALYGNASAAVAVLLRERGGLEVLLTERAKRDTDPWSAQWSFPGGQCHPGESAFDAACRETAEEVHLKPERSQLLGCLAARSPANRPEMLVLPFVFRWNGPEPTPGPEVASTAWILLSELPAARTTATVHVRGPELTIPAFVHDGRKIWGFTYRALEDLLGLLEQ